MSKNYLDTSSPAFEETVEDTGLYKLVDSFADEMKDRLADKFEEGFTGWDDPDNAEYFYDRLTEKLEDLQKEFDIRDLLDIACFAAFLWNFDASKEDE